MTDNLHTFGIPLKVARYLGQFHASIAHRLWIYVCTMHNEWIRMSCIMHIIIYVIVTYTVRNYLINKSVSITVSVVFPRDFSRINSCHLTIKRHYHLAESHTTLINIYSMCVCDVLLQFHSANRRIRFNLFVNILWNVCMCNRYDLPLYSGSVVCHCCNGYYCRSLVRLLQFEKVITTVWPSNWTWQNKQ